MSENFSSLLSQWKTARDPYGAGKPLANNTRIFQRGEDVMAIRFHATDILRFHRDGSIQVIDSWTDSPTTNGRISEYSRIHRYNQLLPSYNGRRPSPNKATCIRMVDRGYSWGDGKHAVCNAKGDYIRFDAMGKLDLTTIVPLQIGTITDKLTLGRLMRRGKQICERIHGVQKLGFKFERHAGDGRYHDLSHWLQAMVSKAATEIDVTQAPSYGAYFEDGLMAPEKTLAELHWPIAKSHRLTEDLEITEFAT